VTIPHATETQRNTAGSGSSNEPGCEEDSERGFTKSRKHLYNAIPLRRHTQLPSNCHLGSCFSSSATRFSCGLGRSQIHPRTRMRSFVLIPISARNGSETNVAGAIDPCRKVGLLRRRRLLSWSLASFSFLYVRPDRHWRVSCSAEESDTVSELRQHLNRARRGII
jgi:hypothetical protein